MNALIEKLRSVKWEVVEDHDRMPDDPTFKCVFVDMRPADFSALLTEAAAALEAAHIGLRYVVRYWVVSDKIKWSEEEIDEVVENVIRNAKREAGLNEKEEYEQPAQCTEVEGMTLTDVIKMAREAGGYDGHVGPPTNWDDGDFVISPEQLLTFAALVRNAALEEVREDAERYRCLRSMATQQADYLGPIFRIDVRRTTPQTLFNFDAAVDHARAALEKENSND